MGVLKVLEGDIPGRIVVLNLEKMVLGRHPDCNIVVDNAAVSRRHAQFLENHGTYYVEDLHSRNGTLVNGQRIDGRTEMHDTDVVKVCDVLFRFHTGAPPNISPTSVARSAETQTIENETVRGLKSEELPPTPEPLPVNNGDSHSSVISSLDASSSATQISLNVRPEAKLSAVLAIGQDLAAAIQVDDVLPRILESLFQIFPQADRGIVLLQDRESEHLIVKATKSRNPADADSAPVSQAIIGRAAETKQAFLSANAEQDIQFDNSESISNFSIRSLMCAPMIGPGDELFGVIQIDSKTSKSGFVPDDLEILATVAGQAAIVVEKALLYQRAEKFRDLERELNFATQIQLGFLPTERPKIPGYEFFHYYEAAQSVGGDFFDYLTLPDDQIAITLGDVAGKGVPAALMMSRLYADARYRFLMQKTAGKALAKLNDDVVLGGHGHRFVTYIGMILDPETHQLRIANAGHMPPLLKAIDGNVEKLGGEQANLPLGVEPGLVYEELTIELAPGEAIILYTDGVTEATNPAHELYGTRRLMSNISAAPIGIEALGQELIESVEQFCEGESQRDDICLLCFRRLPE